MKIYYSSGMMMDMTIEEFIALTNCNSQDNIEELKFASVEKCVDKPAKTKKEPKEGCTKKKPLDDGKIIALRKAGWTWENIRDELDYTCSVQTIINHYNAAVETLAIGGAEDENKE